MQKDSQVFKIEDKSMRNVISSLLLLLLMTLPLIAQEFGSVSGIVLTGDREAVEGAFVTLRAEDDHGGGHGGHGGENHMLRTETDEEGRFRFNRVEAGEYEISAMVHEVGMIEEEISVVANEETIIELIFDGVGGDDEGIGGLAGLVFNPDEEPIGNAEVVLMLDMHGGHGDRGGQHGMFITRSNDGGGFAFDEVPIGDWVLTVGKFGFLPFESQVEINDGEVTEVNVILEVQDENVEYGSVSGIVLDVNEEPIELAHIMLMPEAEHEDDHGHHGGHNGRHGWMEPLVAFTDENGIFGFDQVPVGDYESRATKRGYENGDEGISVLVDEETEVNFILAEGDDHDDGHGDHRGGHGDHNGDQVELHGWVIIAEDEHMDIYLLDEDRDGEEEYILNFGPPDYRPGNGLERPADGDEIDIVGLEVGHMEPSMIIVLQINGGLWRDIENNGHGGRHGGGPGWGHDPDQLEMIEADGFSIRSDQVHWWNRHFIDTDENGSADFRLFFGDSGYEPGNGVNLPASGDFVDIIGGIYSPEQGLPVIIVYQINGNFWRQPGDTLGLSWDDSPQKVNDPGETIPNTITLVETYPNPFNPALNVSVTLTREALLTAKLYNLAGQEVFNADLGNKSIGHHKFTIQADQFGTGAYILSLETNGERAVRKVTLVK